MSEEAISAGMAHGFGEEISEHRLDVSVVIEVGILPREDCPAEPPL